MRVAVHKRVIDVSMPPPQPCTSDEYVLNGYAEVLMIHGKTAIAK